MVHRCTAVNCSLGNTSSARAGSPCAEADLGAEAKTEAVVAVEVELDELDLYADGLATGLLTGIAVLRPNASSNHALFSFNQVGVGA